MEPIDSLPLSKLDTANGEEEYQDLIDQQERLLKAQVDVSYFISGIFFIVFTILIVKVIRKSSRFSRTHSIIAGYVFL